MIITLCGSTRFKEQFLSIASELTLKGHIVLMPFAFHHSTNDEDLKKRIMSVKPMLDKLHFEKIRMSDCIVVIDVNSYYGESTKNEVEYARRNNKDIYWFSNLSYLNIK